MSRTVKCAKLGIELPGLDSPPFVGPIGQLIFERVSLQAWKAWRDDMQLKVINEYRLNMGDRKHYDTLIDQMLIFLNLKEGAVKKVDDGRAS